MTTDEKREILEAIGYAFEWLLPCIPTALLPDGSEYGAHTMNDAIVFAWEHYQFHKTMREMTEKYGKKPSA